MNQPSHDDLLDLALRDSVGGRIASAANAAAVSAFASSALRRYLSSAAGSWRALPAPTRIRLVALVGVVAMLVHRAMARLGQPEPLGAVVPFVIVAACALTALLADRIGRVWERLAP